MSDGQERSERPTARRLAKARAQGARQTSAIAAGWLALWLAAFPALLAHRAADRWLDMWRTAGLHAAALARSAHATDLTNTLLLWLSWPEAWLLVCAGGSAALMAAVGAAAASGALSIAPQALRPRFDRLSWAAGVRQLVSAEGAAQAAGAFACGTIVLACSWRATLDIRQLAEAALTPAGAAAAAAHVLQDLWWNLGIALAAPVCFDVWRVRRRASAALRMTPREVREEHAEAEGRPELRARRRAQATEMTRSVRVGAIRRATAVVANPTHVAVALRYAPPSIDVPIIVARGADLAAVLVRAIAALHDVPVIESPELARTLYAGVALGEPIPPECYAAVAAIFAWLQHTRGCLSGASEP